MDFEIHIKPLFIECMYVSGIVLGLGNAKVGLLQS